MEEQLQNASTEQHALNDVIEADSTTTQHTTQQHKPTSWLTLSIIATLIFFLPFGIVALVYASQVNTLYKCGEKDQAQEYSKKARNWIIASVITGTILFIIFFAIVSHVVGDISESIENSRANSNGDLRLMIDRFLDSYNS